MPSLACAPVAVGPDYANVKPAVTAPFKNAKKSILAKHAAMKKEAALREKQAAMAAAIATPPTSKNPSPRNIPMSPSSCPPTPMRTPAAASVEQGKPAVPKMRGTEDSKKNTAATRSKNPPTPAPALSALGKRKAAAKAEAVLQPEAAPNNHACSFSAAASAPASQAGRDQEGDTMWFQDRQAAVQGGGHAIAGEFRTTYPVPFRCSCNMLTPYILFRAYIGSCPEHSSFD